MAKDTSSDITIISNDDIKSKIYTIRGMQVMQAWREARSRETGRSPGRQRRGEEKDRTAQKIKGSSVALGKAPENLTDSQRTRVGFIAGATKLYRAYCLKESLRTLIRIYQGGYEKAFLFEIDSFFE